MGGDTAERAIPLLERLRKEGKGCLFAYSVEVDEAEAAGSSSQKSSLSPHKQIVQETLHSIDVAADFEDRYGKGSTGKRTWVAIKLVRNPRRHLSLSHVFNTYVGYTDCDVTERGFTPPSFAISDRLSACDVSIGAIPGSSPAFRSRCAHNSVDHRSSERRRLEVAPRASGRPCGYLYAGSGEGHSIGL